MVFEDLAKHSPCGIQVYSGEACVYSNREWEALPFPLVVSLSEGQVDRITIADQVYRVTASKIPNAVVVYYQDITDLVERTQELERSNEEFTHFAYVASHDLQEPLRMVSSYVQILFEEYGHLMDDSASVYVRHITDGTRRMKVLIEDLLRLAKVGSVSGPKSVFDAGKCVIEAVDALRPIVDSTNAIIDCDTLPDGYGHPSLITQVFQNLIHNAIKYRKDGPPRIHISGEEIEGGVRYSVRDEGIGIEPEYHDRIFLLFHRLHSRSRDPGSGVGLTICDKIVRLHGGAIWVESELGSGSTFFFEIPNECTVD